MPRGKRKSNGAPIQGAPFFAFGSERERAAALLACTVVASFAVVFAIMFAFGGFEPRSAAVAPADGQASQDGGLSESGAQDEGWATAAASAYSLEDNDGWDQTASGIPLDETTPTVAVPMERSDLMGSQVELDYEGTVVRATVTDVGSFGDEGRLFDLSPAVWRAFGFASVDDWGVREVSYRFLS